MEHYWNFYLKKKVQKRGCSWKSIRTILIWVRLMAEPHFNIIWPIVWVYHCSVGHILYVKQQDPLCDAKLCGLLRSSSSRLLKVVIGSSSLMQIVAAENPSLSQVQSPQKPTAIFVAGCEEEPQGVFLKMDGKPCVFAAAPGFVWTQPW